MPDRRPRKFSAVRSAGQQRARRCPRPPARPPPPRATRPPGRAARSAHRGRGGGTTASATVEPGDHARRLLGDRRPRPGAGVDRRGRRRVTVADVLGQRAVDQVVELGRLDVAEHDDGAEGRVAGAVQPRAEARELAQVGDRLGGDALARQQRRDARRVAGDRLGRDAPDGVVDATTSARAEERLARRHDDLVDERAGGPHERLGVARALDPAHRRREVAREAIERLRGLARGRGRARSSRAWRARPGRRRPSAGRRRPRSRCSRCRARR